MLEVDVLGAALLARGPSTEEIASLCEATASRVGVHHGHVAVEFVDERRIAELNERHRGRTGATDVLSFPIDGGPASSADAGQVELGDVVICPERTIDIGEAVVHGMLHLLGMDHETDDGEMLALQDELLAEPRP